MAGFEKKGPTPTTIRLEAEELEGIAELRQLMKKPDGAPATQTEILRRALPLGLAALRQEALAAQVDFTGRLCLALSQGVLSLPVPVPGMELIRVLASAPIPAKRSFWSSAEWHAIQVDNREALEAFREALPQIRHFPLSVPSLLLSYPADGRCRRGEDIRGVLLERADWSRTGWAQVRFWALGPWAIGVLSHVPIDQLPGVSVTNGAEDLVAFLCQVFGLDWTRIIWVDHRSEAVFGTALGGEQHQALLIEGDPRSVEHLQVRNWVGLPIEEMRRVLGVKE